MEVFVYPAEPLIDSQLRLIELLPGRDEETLSCAVRVIERGFNVPYKALSYAWGDTSANHRILVDGKSFWLHQNLCEALNAIREEHDSVVLWTDRICINQNDVSERNAQVQRMGRTYAEAEEVLIWLGSSFKDFRDLSVVQRVSRNPQSLTGAEWRLALPSIQYVLDKPWFDRLWVVQEVMLARKGTVLLGQESMDLHDLLKFAEIDWKPIALLFLDAMNNNPRLIEAFDGNPDFIFDLHTNSSARDLQRLDERIFFIRDVSAFRRKDLKGVPATEILELLVTLTRQRRCFDPHDHIYGILGVLRPFCDSLLDVDYTEPTEDLFIRVAKTIFTEDINGLIRLEFHNVERSAADSSRLSLPSWVPDFSTKGKELSVFGEHFFYAGSRDNQSSVPVKAPCFTSRTLKLSGYVVDIIDEASDVASSQFSGVLASSQVVELEKRFVGDGQRASPYGDYARQLEAFWRTLAADCAQDKDNVVTRRRLDDNGTSYEFFIHRASPLHKPDASKFQEHIDAYSEFSTTAGLPPHGRQVFRTVFGHLGLGPRRIVAQDDFVMVIPGLNMPIVLRAVSDDEDDSQVYLLGPCYLHGFMDGEAIDMYEDPESTGVVNQLGLGMVDIEIV